jgi:hypothetical protein
MSRNFRRSVLDKFSVKNLSNIWVRHPLTSVNTNAVAYAFSRAYGVRHCTHLDGLGNSSTVVTGFPLGTLVPSVSGGGVL